MSQVIQETTDRRFQGTELRRDGSVGRATVRITTFRCQGMGQEGMGSGPLVPPFPRWWKGCWRGID